MSKNKTENYTFFFKDGYFVTFPLTNSEFSAVKDSFTSKKDTLILENYIILLGDVRYVAKQKEPLPAESAVPEHMEQDVYEYLKFLERGVRNGEKEAATSGY